MTGTRGIQRRTLLVAGVMAILATKGSNRLLAREPSSSGDNMVERLGAAIEAYDAQGIHRTGTPVDNVSADWLSGLVRQVGADPMLEPFALSRIDPQDCYVRVGNRQIDGVPLFDATFTPAEGVRGTLGPIGSDAVIGVAETEPSRLTVPGSEAQRARMSEVRKAKHKAVVLLTRGARPGLFLLNAPAFKTPFGPPTLQISSAEAEWLNSMAQQRAEARIRRPRPTERGAGFQCHGSNCGE